MKPQEVSIELKLSREITDGEWAGLSLGAKATLEPDETLAQGAERLYGELAAQFKLLWSREGKAVAPKPAEEEHKDPFVRADPAYSPTPPEEEPIEDPSWCPIHETGMVLHEKGSQKWYSHKLENGTWCNGKPQEKKPDPSYCPIHKINMDKHEKGGKTWYSHKVGSGWCKGMAAKKEQG